MGNVTVKIPVGFEIPAQPVEAIPKYTDRGIIFVD